MCATHEIYVVLKAMRNYCSIRRSFKAARPNKWATHETYVVLKAIRINSRRSLSREAKQCAAQNVSRS